MPQKHSFNLSGPLVREPQSASRLTTSRWRPRSMPATSRVPLHSSNLQSPCSHDRISELPCQSPLGRSKYRPRLPALRQSRCSLCSSRPRQPCRRCRQHWSPGIKPPDPAVTVATTTTKPGQPAQLVAAHVAASKTWSAMRRSISWVCGSTIVHV